MVRKVCHLFHPPAKLSFVLHLHKHGKGPGCGLVSVWGLLDFGQKRLPKLKGKKTGYIYILSNCYHKEGLTKIKHSFLNGTIVGTDRISGNMAANRMLKLFIIRQYPKLY